MATWTISGTYLEFCNCDPGCGCNFKGSPNSAEGNCQALLGHRIEKGAFAGLDLAGSKVVWALWWPGAVDRVAIDLQVDGKSSSISVNGIADAVMTPLRSPVSGEVNNVRIVKEGGFIWAEGEIATNERIKVETPEISFEVAGRHSVFAPFEYANS